MLISAFTGKKSLSVVDVQYPQSVNLNFFMIKYGVGDTNNALHFTSIFSPTQRERLRTLNTSVQSDLNNTLWFKKKKNHLNLWLNENGITAKRAVACCYQKEVKYSIH